MTVVSLAVRNALRNKFRALLTIAGAATAVLTFVMLRTVLHAWHLGIETAAKDRLATRAKVSFVIPLPSRYGSELQSIAGIKAASYGNMFGGRMPKAPNEMFQTIAAAENIFEIYPEMHIAPEALERWRHDKIGAIAGDVLAKRLGLHVGDKVILEGTMYPGDWEFTIDGFYSTSNHSAVDRATLYFHWDYLNEGAPDAQKNFVGMLLSRVDDPAHSAAVSRSIDALFDDHEIQTTTTSERAMTNSLLKGSGAILEALNAVSLIILGIMTLIVGNTIAMGVRERTIEFGVLRTIGFTSTQVRRLILGEAFALTTLAAALGCALAYPLAQFGGRWIEENMGQFFPSFSTSWSTVALSLSLTVTLGCTAALIPAWRVGRMQVTDSLREVT